MSKKNTNKTNQNMNKKNTNVNNTKTNQNKWSVEINPARRFDCIAIQLVAFDYGFHWKDEDASVREFIESGYLIFNDDDATMEFSMKYSTNIPVYSYEDSINQFESEISFDNDNILVKKNGDVDIDGRIFSKETIDEFIKTRDSFINKSSLPLNNHNGGYEDVKNYLDGILEMKNNDEMFQKISKKNTKSCPNPFYKSDKDLFYEKSNEIKFTEPLMAQFLYKNENEVSGYKKYLVSVTSVDDKHLNGVDQSDGQYKTFLSSKIHNYSNLLTQLKQLGH